MVRIAPETHSHRVDVVLIVLVEVEKVKPG